MVTHAMDTASRRIAPREIHLPGIRTWQTLLAGLAISAGAGAQITHQHGTDERLMMAVTEQRFVVDQTPVDLARLKNEGWRITALDLQDAREWTFTAALVRNVGPYARDWWFGTTFTVKSLVEKLGATNSRLIDIEPVWFRSELYFAAVAVAKQPGDPDSWLAVGKTMSELQAVYQARSARLVDLERYTPTGASTHVYAAIMVQNTGPHFQKWSWILNATESALSAALSSKGMRPYDLERTPDDRFDCLMVESGVSATRYELHRSHVAAELIRRSLKMRLIDVEYSPGTDRFDVVMIRNSLEGSATPFGKSCFSGFSSSLVAPNDEPRIGEMVEFRLDASRGIGFSGFVSLLIGASRTSLHGVPLPLDLGVIGAPGCQLLTSSEVAIPALAAPSAIVAVKIPDDVALVGARVYSQFLVPYPGVNGAGLVTTNGVAVVIGGDGG